MTKKIRPVARRRKRGDETKYERYSSGITNSDCHMSPNLDSITPSNADLTCACYHILILRRSSWQPSKIR